MLLQALRCSSAHPVVGKPLFSIALPVSRDPTRDVLRLRPGLFVIRRRTLTYQSPKGESVMCFKVSRFFPI